MRFFRKLIRAILRRWRKREIINRCEIVVKNETFVDPRERQWEIPLPPGKRNRERDSHARQKDTPFRGRGETMSGEKKREWLDLAFDATRARPDLLFPPQMRTLFFPNRSKRTIVWQTTCHVLRESTYRYAMFSTIPAM